MLNWQRRKRHIGERITCDQTKTIQPPSVVVSRDGPLDRNGPDTLRGQAWPPASIQTLADALLIRNVYLGHYGLVDILSAIELWTMTVYGMCFEWYPFCTESKEDSVLVVTARWVKRRTYATFPHSLSNNECGKVASFPMY